MDKNYIIELLKANRLQEALKAIEQASEGSHLHNQVIMLSSSYAEYVQLNRSATQDFQTLEMQRAKITNSLLSFLDELAPEDFEKADVQQTRIYQTPQTPQPSATIGINKNYLYIGGGILLLIILYFAFLSEPTTTIVEPTTELNQSIPEDNIPTASENTPVNTPPEVATKPAVVNDEKPEKQPVQSTPTKTVEITGKNVQYVAYDKGHFIKDGSSWIEETDAGGSFRFKEVSRENCCVHIRDEARKMDITFDLPLKQMKYHYDKGDSGILYYITEVDKE